MLHFGVKKNWTKIYQPTARIIFILPSCTKTTIKTSQTMFEECQEMDSRGTVKVRGGEQAISFFSFKDFVHIVRLQIPLFSEQDNFLLKRGLRIIF